MRGGSMREIIPVFTIQKNTESLCQLWLFSVFFGMCTAHSNVTCPLDVYTCVAVMRCGDLVRLSGYIRRVPSSIPILLLACFSPVA